MKTKDYQIFERREGNWIYAHIVGETPEALADGIAWYRRTYKFHDCGWPFDETGQTANLKRYYKM